MILTYQPQLENPPMHKEATIAFSFMGKGATMDSIDIQAGVNRDFPENVWEKIQNYDYVKTLLSIGALRVTEDVEEVPTPSTPEVTTDSLAQLPKEEALQLVEASMDPAQLSRWNATDNRIPVKNAIQRRLNAISEGKG